MFGSSAGYELPSGDTLAPDVSFLSRVRREVSGAGLDEFVPVAPDLAVEILSPSSIARDRVEKRAIYATNGVREYWIVDPQRRSIEIVPLAGDASGNTTVVSIGPVASRVLPGLELRAEEVFAEPV